MPAPLLYLFYLLLGVAVFALLYLFTARVERW